MIKTAETRPETTQTKKILKTTEVGVLWHIVGQPDEIDREAKTSEAHVNQ